MGNQQAIVIVDDDPNMSEGVSEILELEGFATHCAKNAQEGAKTAQAVRPAAVLTDFTLPDANGMQLCQWVKKNLPGTVVILASGRVFSPQERNIPNGPDEYLLKPFDIANLGKTISRIVAEKGMKK